MKQSCCRSTSLPVGSGKTPFMDSGLRAETDSFVGTKMTRHYDHMTKKHNASAAYCWQRHKKINKCRTCFSECRKLFWLYRLRAWCHVPSRRINVYLTSEAPRWRCLAKKLPRSSASGPGHISSVFGWAIIDSNTGNLTVTFAHAPELGRHHIRTSAMNN